MTSFYIVPPRKTQLGDNGISISGTLGVITTNPGGAAITGVGALKLDATYSPTWTGTHTFTQPIIFSGSQTISSTLISASGQTAGDLFYYTGTSWSRLAVGSNNKILQSFGGGIGWTGGVNLSNVITGNLKIGSLSGVLKASSGVVSGNSGIGDLSNVLLNLPASGNFLKYNGTKWVNSPIPLSDHNIIIRFLNGYTPAQTGIDIEAATVPYEPSDGTTVLEYTITRIVLQAEIAGSTSSQVTIERALNGQEFDDPMTLGNTIETLTLTSGSYQASSNGPFFKIYSGERLRLNINSIGTGAQQWTVQIEGTAGNPYNGTNAGITSINSLAAQLQTMVVGSGGTDFNISSVIDTHTFNIPSASGSNRGLVTTTNQTFAGIKTFNNTSVTTSTTTGSVIISGGVGIGESIYIGGNVVVGNNLILNNALGLTYGGTGLTTIGASNTFLAVNNAGSSLEYKKLIAGTGITFNFSGSEIILESTGGIGGTVISGGGGISSLNGISYINYPEQSFATGSSGTDFNIVSIGSTHTFNIPVAGSGSSGIVTTNSQIFSGIKTFNNNLIAQSDFNVSGSSNLTSAVGVSSEVNISGGLGVTGASILRSTLQVSGITTIFNSTNTSSTTAGALVVSGGVGISGALFVGSGANISSNNVSSTTTSSGLVFRANSLTTGTGAYFASNSLTTGKLLDIAVSGNTAIGGRIGINVAVSGVNTNTGVTTYGIFTNNISTNTATNIGLGTFANGDSYNIPLRLGLSTNKYINFFINSEGNGLTLSPTGTGTPFLALGGYAGTTAELRLLQSGGFGSPKYIALKATDTVTNTYDLIFPNSYPVSSNMALVGTGTTQVTLSWTSLSSGGIGGTINAGDQYKLAFYVNPNGSSTLDDAQALAYSTSGANLTISSTAASVIPLKLVGAVSQTADLLQVATSSSNIFTIDKDGIGNFTNNLTISSNTSSTSSSSGALSVTGGVGVSGNIFAGSNININNAANIGSGLGVSGNTNISGGLGVTGSSLFRSSVVIQDGGLGVTGATLLNSSLTVSGSSVLNSTLNVIGNVNFASAFNVGGASNVSGLGVSANLNITGGLGITGKSLFRDSVIIQSGGLGVSGGLVITQGGLGVTGATTLRSTLSVLGTASFATINQGTWNGSAIGLSYGGTGLGTSGTANQMLGMSNDSSGLEYKTLIAGSNVTILNSTNSITISAASGGGSGTVNSGSITQVAYYAVGGTSVSGTSNLTIGSSGVGISFSTQSTSSSTGALIILGGLGVSGNVNVGTGLTVLGTVHAASNTNSTSSTSGALIVTGGIGASGRIWAGSGISSQGGGTFTGALSASSLTLSSALSISSGGTGLGSSGVANQILGMNNASSALEYKTLTAGSNISIVHGSGTVTLDVVGFGISSLNGLNNTTQAFATGYSGTDFNIVSIGSTHTFNIPVAGSGSSGIITTGTQTIAGAKIFTGGIIVQSVGLGVTGGIVVTQGGLGVTGATVLNSSLTVATSTILNSTLNVAGNTNIASDVNIGGATNISGLGVSNNINITGGLGVTGTSLFRNTVTVQSGGMGVTGGVFITQGGLGVTGAAYFSSSISAGSLVLTTALPITSGGTGLGAAGTANYILGMNVAGNALEYKQLVEGTNITISQTSGTITISASGAGGGGGSGTVNNGNVGQVAFYSTTGTTVSGNTFLYIGSVGVGISATTQSTSSTTGGLVVDGGLGVGGNLNVGTGLTVTGASGFSSTLFVSGYAYHGSGAGFQSTVDIQGGLGVTGQSIFRNNIEIKSGGLGVTGAVNISSTLGVQGSGNFSGGLGVTGQSIFRNNVEIQSGGLGVTGAAVFNSSISAGSLSLSTALPLSSGGTGLGSTSLANHVLGMNNSSLGLEYKQIIQGSNITITHNANSITIAAASSSATPGGPNSAIQYNSSNTLAGASAFLWDNASQRIDIKNTNAIGTGTTTSFLLQNSTASTVSVQMQFSPAIEQIGRAWKTSGSPATDTLVRYLQIVEVTSGATPTGTITWKSAIHNASNQGPTYVKRAEISTNYGLGIYETTGVYKSSIINSASATTDIYYTLPAALPSLNQALTVTGISVSSVTLSWISNGTVASGASGALAYYSGTGTTVDDATGLAYASSGTHLIITSQNATDVPLRVDGHASSSVNLFQVRKGTTDQLVINSNGDVSIASAVDSTSSTTGALTITGGVGIGSSVYVSGNLTVNRNLTITQTTEKFNNFTSNIAPGGTVTFNSITAGNILYVNTGTVSGNWTLDVTNLSLTSGFSGALVVSIFQGATAYMPTVLKIDGVTQTVIWQGGGGVPTGNANKYDFVNYSILCTASSTYVVFGQLVSFG